MPRRTALVLLTAMVLLSACSRAPAPSPPLPTPSPPPESSAAVSDPQPPPFDGWSYSVLAFRNAQDGWVALSLSDRTAIVRTTDGGSTWTRTGAPAFRMLALRFIDDKRGAALGTAFGCEARGRECALLIATTADGGATWETRFDHRLEEGLSDNLPVLAFTADGTGYALYAGSRDSLLVTSSDGGQTWKPVKAPAAGWVFQSAAFISTALGWAHARNCQTAGRQEECRYAIFATADGGSHWQRQADLPDGRRMRPGKIEFADASHGWLYPTALAARCTIAACAGPLYRTRDGGQTWAEFSASPGGPGIPLSVSFAGTDRGWMLISAGDPDGVGGVGVTADGGETWVRHLPEGMRDIQMLSAVSGEIAWVVASAPGRPGVLMRTTDGGATWSPVSAPLSD